MKLYAILTSLFFLFSANLSAQEIVSQPELVNLDGTRVNASLLSVDESWNLEFQLEQNREKYNGTNIFSWGKPKKPILTNRYLIILAHGGELLAYEVDYSADSFLVDSNTFGLVRIPRADVSAVLFNPPEDPKRWREIYQKINDAHQDWDRLFLKTGDSILGQMTRVAEQTPENIRYAQLKTEFGAETKIPQSQLALWVLKKSRRKEIPAKEPRAIVGISDGSWFVTKSLSYSSSELLIRPFGYAADAGIVWKTRKKEAIRYLQMFHTRIQYLGELKPFAYRNIPFLDLEWEYQVDKNVLGETLQCDQQRYFSGIGVHSTALLAYKLQKPYQRFEADIALDDAAGFGGSVQFQILVDGKAKFASETIRGKTSPTPVSIDISGAKNIALVVTFADRGDQLDYANWLNARLILQE